MISTNLFPTLKASNQVKKFHYNWIDPREENEKNKEINFDEKLAN